MKKIVLSNISKTFCPQTLNLNISPLTFPPSARLFPKTPPPSPAPLFLDSLEAIGVASNLTSSIFLNCSLLANTRLIAPEGSEQIQISTIFTFSLMQDLTAIHSMDIDLSTTNELVTTSAGSIELLGLDQLSMDEMSE